MQPADSPGSWRTACREGTSSESAELYSSPGGGCRITGVASTGRARGPSYRLSSASQVRSTVMSERHLQDTTGHPQRTFVDGRLRLRSSGLVNRGTVNTARTWYPGCSRRLGAGRSSATRYTACRQIEEWRSHHRCFQNPSSDDVGPHQSRRKRIKRSQVGCRHDRHPRCEGRSHQRHVNRDWHRANRGASHFVDDRLGRRVCPSSAKWGAPLLLSSIGGVVGALIDRAHEGEEILYVAPSTSRIVIDGGSYVSRQRSHKEAQRTHTTLRTSQRPARPGDRAQRSAHLTQF
jgi:hypothetical protein